MPKLAGFRVILDTNTLLRGLERPESASGKIVQAIDRRMLTALTSKRIIDEYRIILTDPSILARHPPLTAESMELAIRSFVYFSENLGVIRTRFEFSRDPKDEKFLALAIAGKASHLLTFDDDLLSLSNDHSDTARRLRQRRIEDFDTATVPESPR